MTRNYSDKSPDTVVYLFPFQAVDFDKYGINYLRAEGYHVVVYDLSPLLKRRSYDKYPKISGGSEESIQKIVSYEGFEEKIKAVSSRAVFIDYLVGLSYLNLENEKIFRLLKKWGCRYFLVSGGALPIGANPDRKAAFREKIVRMLKPKNLADYITRRSILFLSRNTNVYPSPAKIFSGESAILEDYVKRHLLRKEIIVPIHSLDYDRYINYKKQTTQTSAGDYCVFLDEAAVDHPDFALLGMPHLDKEKYTRAINGLLSKIEKETGLQVIIAAHPLSRYENDPAAFDGRQLIKGRTIDLVAGCCFVVAHSSTAISYAVIFDKPILFVKTDDMISKGRSGFIDVMAASVGLKAVNVDSQEEFDDLDLNYRSWSTERYDEYKYSYVKTRGLADQTVWEIVAREIRNTI